MSPFCRKRNHVSYIAQSEQGKVVCGQQGALEPGLNHGCSQAPSVERDRAYWYMKRVTVAGHLASRIIQMCFLRNPVFLIGCQRCWKGTTCRGPPAGDYLPRQLRHRLMLSEQTGDQHLTGSFSTPHPSVKSHIDAYHLQWPQHWLPLVQPGWNDPEVWVSVLKTHPACLIQLRKNHPISCWVDCLLCTFQGRSGS